MSASVRDLLDGAQPVKLAAMTAMTWLAPGSSAPCRYERCVLVGRHDRHDMREAR